MGRSQVVLMTNRCSPQSHRWAWPNMRTITHKCSNKDVESDKMSQIITTIGKVNTVIPYSYLPLRIAPNQNRYIVFCIMQNFTRKCGFRLNHFQISTVKGEHWNESTNQQSSPNAITSGTKLLRKLSVVSLFIIYTYIFATNCSE